MTLGGDRSPTGERSPYVQGNTVVLYEQFLDPETGQPADPNEVTFFVRSPAGSVTAYVLGTDAEVEKVDNDVEGSQWFGATEGFFICTLLNVNMAGVWPYRPEGEWDEGSSAFEYEFEIEASSTIAPVTSGPQFGPFVLWCDPQDVIDRCPSAAGSDTGLLDGFCLAASQVLYELSGRQYVGLSQPVTVRPQASNCGCWPWNETWHSWGQIPWGYWSFDYGLGLWSGCGALGQVAYSGCEPVSRVELAGYPVREIVQVKIGGDVVDPTLYRLDMNRYLVRMRDSENVNAWWPSCDIQNLPDTEPGTFSITYRYGIDPPQIGHMAAAALACELWKATPSGGGDCQLPVGVRRSVRQGLTVDRSLFAQWTRDPKTGAWAVGIPEVDTFLNSYNPSGLRRTASVRSPWVKPFPLRPGV